MTAKIIDGKAIARAVRVGIAARAEALRRKGVQPALTVIVVGDNPASAVYVRNKVNACAEVGIKSEVVRFPAGTNEKEILDRIAVLPEFRRLGIGRRFYDELVRTFTGVWGQLVCEVNLRPRNERSLAFHHSIGFREVGQQETDGGRKTVSLLSLDLSARPTAPDTPDPTS